MANQQNGSDKHGRISLDSPMRITRDTALELMTHHLMLAHLYYQGAPDDDQQNAEELDRLLREPHMPADYMPPELVGAKVWLAEMNRIYEKMKEDD